MSDESRKVLPWCVFLLGADDRIHLDSSRAEAVAIAHEMNQQTLALMAEPPSPKYPMIWAVPQLQGAWSDEPVIVDEFLTARDLLNAGGELPAPGGFFATTYCSKCGRSHTSIAGCPRPQK